MYGNRIYRPRLQAGAIYGFRTPSSYATTRGLLLEDAAMIQQPMLPVTETLPKQKRRREEQTMAEFLEACKETGEMAIPANDPAYRYAERAGIPDNFLELCWLEFRERHVDNPTKRYKDWRATFRNAVRDNWYRLWRYADGECVLTVQGEQAARVHGKAVPQRLNRQEMLEARNREVAKTWATSRRPSCPTQAELDAENAKAKAMVFGSASRRPSRHSGFDQIDYREGINEDGSF